MADPPDIHRAAPAVSLTPNDTWICKCLTLNSTIRKRCSNCMRWRPGSRKNGGQASIVSDEDVSAAAAVAARNGVQRRVAAEGEERPIGSWRVLTLKNDNGAVGGENTINDPRSKGIYDRASLYQDASLGCRTYKKEYETGEKIAHGHDAQCPRSQEKTSTQGRNTDHKEVKKHNETRPYSHHRVSLEQAASFGCRKCKLEYETGIKNTRSHDAKCPRSRGPKMGGQVHNNGYPNDKVSTPRVGRHSDACSRSKPVNGGGGAACGTSTTTNGSNVTIKHSIDDGDPPWRTKGNAWIGRRVLYRPKDKTNDTRTCTKSRFYDEDIIYEQKPSSSSSSVAKGTILGFISERDKDSKGNPGFISSRDGRPAILFHVVFDKGNPCFLLNKDFEEWEIKEQCEWIDDESGEKRNSGGADNNDEDTRPEKSDVAKVPYENRAMRSESTANYGSTNASSRRVAFSQDSDENIDETTAVALRPCGSNIKSANDSNVDRPPEKEKFNDNRSGSTKNSTDLNLAISSSFNDALKSALRTYTSTSALGDFNNPPPPIPPPFLSHHEESTLRTALAFVMIKARNKNKDERNTLVTRRLSETGLTGQFTSTRLTALGCESLGWISSAVRRSGNQNERREKSGMKSSLLGGLLSLPQGRCGESKHMSSTENSTLTLGREMNHIRDILKLALSSVAPLYRGALEINGKISSNDDSGTEASNSAESEVTPKHSMRLPSAVYDFEAGYNPLFTGNASQKSLVERHYATLDGLCQHAISRLTRVMKYTAFESKIQQRAKKTQAAKTNNKEHQQPADGGLERHPVDCRESAQTKNFIRDTILKLFYEDVIGDAYHYNEVCQRRTVKNRIEKILSACHVIHRMLFLDQSCCFATEFVIAISRTLADLYSNNYSGVLSGCVDERTKNIEDISGVNKSAHVVSKDRVQIVRPTWLPCSRTAYSSDRNERRIRSIDAILCDTTSFSGGTKRKNLEPDDKGDSDFLLPGVADVLAVNLLRLLECAAAIRLHHHQKKISCKREEYQSCLASKAQSTAATEMLTEIRSSTVLDLTQPIFLDDAAAFYLRESTALHALGRRNNPSLLRPCAKLMLRVHLLGLIKKISSYEQM